MNLPNLFHYATSELSQDAVLCWLIAWADASTAKSDASLHGVGRRLLEVTFELAGVPLPTGPLAVRPSRQIRHADIVVLVGDRHVLLLEDKTDTAEHSNQLQRYESEIRALHPGCTLVPVYVKTGDQSSYRSVRECGWAVLTRRRLIATLREPGVAISNNILSDFVEHLEAIEAEVNSFRTVALAEWGSSWRPWVGFFEAVRSTLNDGDWDYVANPSGGFMGFWWCSRSVDGGQVYLQIEKQRLAVKLTCADDQRRRELRDTWMGRVVEGLRALGFDRPGRLGLGRYMTIASNDKWPALGATGCIDLEANLAMLQAATRCLVGLTPKLDQSSQTPS